MRRAILCGVMMLAGCGRTMSGDRAEGTAHQGGRPVPTAGQDLRRDAPAAGPGAVATGGAEDAGRPRAAELVPDPVYTPREEDRVTLIADATPAFSRASLFDDSYGAPGPVDPDRLREMIERGEMVELEGRLPVLVLRNLDPADAREPGRHYAVEVRVLEGPRRGEAWFVDESAVARLVPRVAHPPLAPGSYATVARPGAIAYAGWEDLEPAARPAGDAAGRESFRVEEGARVVVEAVRGEAVRVRVDPGSGAAGRFGVLPRSDLRPMLPPSGAAPARPADGR